MEASQRTLTAAFIGIVCVLLCLGHGDARSPEKPVTRPHEHEGSTDPHDCPKGFVAYARHKCHVQCQELDDPRNRLKYVFKDKTSCHFNSFEEGECMFGECRRRYRRW